MSRFRKALLAGTAGAALCTLLPHPGLAQTTPSGFSRSDQIETIEVTAEKKSAAQDLQSVPISITAITGQALEEAHITDVTDIGHMIPNVQLEGVGTFPGFANFTIRGVGVTSSVRSVDPAVNIFQDGMVVAYQAGAILGTFDTESVQVLRGPQGVLFGRNSAGGAVLLSTPLPTKDFHFSGDLTLGNDNEVDSHATVQGALSEHVFAKIAGSERYNSGYFNNSTDGTFVPAPDHPSGTPIQHSTGGLGTQEYVIKPTFLFELSDNLKLKLFTQYERYLDGGSPSRSFVPDGLVSPMQQLFGYTAPTGKYTTNIARPGYTDITEGHVITEFDWAIGGGMWTTTAAVRAVKYNSAFDNNGTPFSLTIFPDNKENNNQESLESRYNGSIGDKIEYVVGTYLFSDLSAVFERRALNGVLSGLPVTTTIDQINKWHQTDSTAAAFGNVDYKILPDLTLSAGLRYEDEYKHMHVIPLAACSGPNFTGCPTTYYDSSKSWQGLTPRAVVSYDIAPDIMTYASYTKGFTAGNYNARATTAVAAELPASPEAVNAYEIGFKSQWLDRRLQANVNLYDNEFTNMQRTVLTTINNLIYQTLVNAASATIQGAEVELEAVVAKGLKVNFSGGYTEGKFDTFTGLPAGVNGESLRLDHVPKWNYDVGLEYAFEVPGIPGGFRLGGDYSWKSMVYTDVTNTPYFAQQSFGLLNANLSYYTDGPYWGRLYGRNIQNTDFFDIADKGLGYAKHGGEPRTFGIQVGASF